MTISSKPLYLQMRDSMIDLISGGAWKPGFQIPPEGELARVMGVSSGTARKALELMESQGLIVRRQGRGSFVANPDLEELAGRYTKLRDPEGGPLRSKQVKVIRFERSTGSGLERSRLQLPADAEVYRIRRARAHTGASFLVEDTVLPAELFPDQLKEAEAAQEIGILAHRRGILLGKAEERITVSLPPHDVAELLHHAREEPVMCMDRVVMLLDGRPAEWRVGYCHTDRSYYAAEMN